MKFAVVFAAVVAVATAQFNPYKPQKYTPFPVPPRPAYPAPTPFAPVPTPYVPAPTPYVPAPTYNTPRPAVVNRNNDQANILRYDNEVGPDGSFSYAFDIDNGISAQAQGVPKAFSGNPPVASVVSQGSFSWTSPEGKPIVITYIADENGYQPQGEAIPTPPPVPEAILRSLEYNAKYPQQLKK